MTTIFRFKKSQSAAFVTDTDHFDDPLSVTILPPKDESPQDCELRLRNEQEADRISREIDDSLRESRSTHEKRKKAIKVLLLGQAESGKSTTLKNFRLASTPDHFDSERLAWKTIVQLNLISSVKKIFEVLQAELDLVPVMGSSTPKGSLSPSRSTSAFQIPNNALNDNHRQIRRRLSFLLSMEAVLAHKIPTENFDPEQPESEMHGGWNKGDPTGVMAACRDDVISLWQDPAVRDVLRKHNVRLEDGPGFFLNHAARILDSNYEPTDSDIVRARVRTSGVEEHKFILKNGGKAEDWYVYDIGGSCGMARPYHSYFDDVQAIIFHAPIEFNQYLEEAPMVNRLEHSFHLWKEVCSSSLLANSALILVLSKMDILDATLKAGTSVQKFIPSYGDAPNDLKHVTKYVKEKFSGFQKRLSPQHRPFLCFVTSNTDPHAMFGMLLNTIRTEILKNKLRSPMV